MLYNSTYPCQASTTELQQRAQRSIAELQGSMERLHESLVTSRETLAVLVQATARQALALA